MSNEIHNKELYKEAFDKLHTSVKLDMEVMNMTKAKSRMRISRRLVMVAAVLVAVFAMTCAVNAATGGQVWDNIKLSINGTTQQSEDYIIDENVSVDMQDGDCVDVLIEDNTEINAESGTDATLNIDGEGNASVDIGK